MDRTRSRRLSVSIWTICAAEMGTTRTMKSPVTTWIVSGASPAELDDTRVTTPILPSGRPPESLHPPMPSGPDRCGGATTSRGVPTTSFV